MLFLEALETQGTAHGKQVSPVAPLASVASELLGIGGSRHPDQPDVKGGSKGERGLIQPYLQREDRQIEIHAEMDMLGKMLLG